MSAHQKIHQANLTNWASLFKDQAESGLTIKEWCLQNNVSIHKFYYWRRQAKESYVDSILPDIVPMSLPSTASNSDPLPVSLDPCDFNNSRNLLKSSPVSLTIGDIRIEIGSSASDAMIAGIIKAVRHA